MPMLWSLQCSPRGRRGKGQCARTGSGCGNISVSHKLNLFTCCLNHIHEEGNRANITYSSILISDAEAQVLFQTNTVLGAAQSVSGGAATA